MRDALPDADRRALVIAIGNAFRGDDAVALEVARRLRERAPELDVVETEGEPTRLLDLWEGRDEVVVVDASSGIGAPGSVCRIDVNAEPLPAALHSSSTHHVSLGETLELARALGRLPARTTIVAVEGERFDTGAALSAVAAAAVDRAVEEVVRCTSGT